VPAIVTASAVFASAHVLALWGQDPVAIAMTITILFVPSLGFGAIYEYTGNIVVPALLHGFHNSVVVTIVLLGAQADLQESALWLFSILL
jgi:membrane protease YdiL (CAAX protease family)